MPRQEAEAGGVKLCGIYVSHVVGGAESLEARCYGSVVLRGGMGEEDRRIRVCPTRRIDRREDERGDEIVARLEEDKCIYECIGEHRRNCGPYGEQARTHARERMEDGIKREEGE